MLCLFAILVYTKLLPYTSEVSTSSMALPHASDHEIFRGWGGYVTYTSRFLLTGYVGLILRSTAVATASRSTIEGTANRVVATVVSPGQQ